MEVGTIVNKSSVTHGRSNASMGSKVEAIASHRFTDRLLSSQDRQQVVLARIAERLEQLTPVSLTDGAERPVEQSGTLGVIMSVSAAIEDKLDYVERMLNEF